MTPAVQSIDHLVLTVADIAATIAFYETVLGVEASRFVPADGVPRWALFLGTQKMNLHEAGREFEPKARHPTSGSADLCFLSETPLEQWQAHLARQGVPVLLGPVPRSGAQGALLSLYLRDPDGNLLEIANPL